MENISVLQVKLVPQFLELEFINMSTVSRQRAKAKGVQCHQGKLLVFCTVLEKKGGRTEMKRANDHHSSEILKHGYLLKKSRIPKKWKLGYFVLNKDCLCYYRNEKDWKENALKEVIFFNDISVYIDELPDKKTKYCIKIVKKLQSNKIVRSRTFLLGCFSEEERNEWLSEILYAKATALVVDLTMLDRNKNISRTKSFDLELSSSVCAAERMGGKYVLHRCRRTFPLIEGVRYSSTSMNVYVTA